MKYPDFFRDVPRLQVYEPLAAFLGAAENGLLEYGYEDAVKLAGHSCPTVASAYALGCRALAMLYPDRLPERGGVRIEFANSQEDGVTGVIASILTLLTGAATGGGFKGIGGRFVRRDPLHFAVKLPMSLRFTRIDNGAAVDAAIDLARVPPDTKTAELMARCLQGKADAAEQQQFGELGQRRVARILLEHWNDNEVFQLRPVHPQI
ncbi:Formylmethanofuran dehydrogenase subunit E [Formivibrio citricus]|uniref:Formylmethanofuran dehydrogenase subunit E n=1 Tax=Formivibrio citricus TaxID=83765 RepID=A0A1I5CL61_9NEIS|nr:hypothetical protein [Formivibrio citricus]SFN87739.1 Formylmethanofuran dehydrogenase subunit E [Formivibrio citricus]